MKKLSMSGQVLVILMTTGLFVACGETDVAIDLKNQHDTLEEKYVDTPKQVSATATTPKPMLDEEPRVFSTPRVEQHVAIKEKTKQIPAEAKTTKQMIMGNWMSTSSNQYELMVFNENGTLDIQIPLYDETDPRYKMGDPEITGTYKWIDEFTLQMLHYYTFPNGQEVEHVIQEANLEYVTDSELVISFDGRTHHFLK